MSVFNTDLQFSFTVFVVIVIHMSIMLVPAGKLKLLTDIYKEEESGVLDIFAAVLVTISEVVQRALENIRR